ncbi:hypothetical protein IAR50_003950 [Cryptococcus sp. DSM 104548]
MTHLHNLKNDNDYTRFWFLLVGLYSSSIEDQGFNKHIRFYSDARGDMRLWERPDIWSNSTRVDALVLPESDQVTTYEDARRGLPQVRNKRKVTEDHVSESVKRPRLERRWELRELLLPSPVPAKGQFASCPLFSFDTIGQLPQTCIIESTTKAVHNVETVTFRLVYRYDAVEREIYKSLNESILSGQSLLGIARFLSRYEGHAFRPGIQKREVEGGSEKVYYFGVNKDEDYKFEGWHYLISCLSVVSGIALTLYAGGRGGEVAALKEKPVTPRIETFKKSVNNIIAGQTEDFELCNYDEDTERVETIGYETDCLFEENDGTDEKLCGMLIDFDLSVKREREVQASSDDKAFSENTKSHGDYHPPRPAENRQSGSSLGCSFANV